MYVTQSDVPEQCGKAVAHCGGKQCMDCKNSMYWDR